MEVLMVVDQQINWL